MRVRTVMLAAIVLVAFVHLPAWQKPKAEAFNTAQLGWMSGSWSTTQGGSTIEEHWSAPAAGTMIGMGRTIAGTKTLFFEYLRIEGRADGTYYVAHPKARPGTDFKLVRYSSNEVVFENPQHDFPKRIIYHKNSDGSITARVEGDPGDQEKAEEFHYRRMK